MERESREVSFAKMHFYNLRWASSAVNEVNRTDGGFNHFSGLGSHPILNGEAYSNPRSLRVYGRLIGAICQRPRIVIGFLCKVSSPPHLTPLKYSNSCINNDSHQCYRFHHRLIEFAAFVIFVSGFTTCLYGVLNLKLGQGDWRGVVAIPVGLILTALGFSLFLYCVAQKPEFAPNVPQFCEQKIDRFL
jgi:hypothetical protein